MLRRAFENTQNRSHLPQSRKDILDREALLLGVRKRLFAELKGALQQRSLEIAVTRLPVANVAMQQPWRRRRR